MNASRSPANGELRHAGQHGEDPVVVARRHRCEELRPDRIGRAKVNCAIAAAGSLPSAKANVAVAPSLSTAKPTDQGPRQAARTASPAHGLDQAAALGPGAHDGSITLSTAGW